MTLKEMAELCGVKDLKYFRESYITPALEMGAIERLYPEQPKHPKQKYRLTEKAKEWKKVQCPSVQMSRGYAPLLLDSWTFGQWRGERGDEKKLLRGATAFLFGDQSERLVLDRNLRVIHQDNFGLMKFVI